MKTFLYKAKAIIHIIFVVNRKNSKFYWYLYRAYWHRFSKENIHSDCEQYITARPNPGAGIGHQLANWFSGYKIANFFSLKYAVYPFSDLSNPLCANEWNDFLGLNNGETYVEDLLKCGYKQILLPKVNFDDANELTILRKIIESYKGVKVVFLLEIDQFAGSELEMVDIFRRKFNSSKKREGERLLFDESHFNVAVHIRRGDIVQKRKKKNSNLTMRWLDLDYYWDVLDKYLSFYSKGKIVDVYLFSQAEKNELEGFEKFGNVIYCNEMDSRTSFLHMVNSDFFVMSRSGMSYQAAKLNEKGIIVFPKGFWREPLISDKWIIP